MGSIFSTSSDAATSKKKNHDVYDATSRSVELPLHTIPSSLILADESLYDESQKRVKRDEIDFAAKGCASSHGFVLKDFFSAAECEALVAATEDIGYNQHSDLKTEYPENYRSNSRLIVFQHTIAAAIWARLLPHLREADVAGVTPIGFATQGTWLPIGINECLLFSRYEQGQFFKPHNDGMYQSFEGDCSIYTVTIYLNDDFEGGQVRFLNGTAEEHTHVHTFRPERGAALIFNHDTLHEGKKVENGNKYILRTSIMFRRVQNLSDPLKKWKNNRNWQDMHDLFAAFTDLQNEKDPAKFTARFLAAQTIQIRNGRSLHAPVPLPFPADVFREIFQMVTVETLVKMFMVSQSAKQASRSGQIWKDRLAKDVGMRLDQLLGSDRLMTKADASLVDWYPIYKRLHRNKTLFDPIVSYLTAKTIFSRSLESSTVHTGSTLTSQGTYPWDCSFGWWTVTDSASEGDGWITPNGLVRDSHVMCLLKTAAGAVNVPLQNVPMRSLVLIAHPIFSKSWDGKGPTHINEPKQWQAINYIADNISSRWKYAALGVVNSIRAALMHANFKNALVITSCRRKDTTKLCWIQIYVCANQLVTSTMDFGVPLDQFGETFEIEIPKLARVHSIKQVVFISDMDPLQPSVAWSGEKAEIEMAEVISDISPSHFEAFAASERCQSAGLEVQLAYPSDLVNAGMLMACSDKYDDIWAKMRPNFFEMKNLKV